jgi:hypothetical protein
MRALLAVSSIFPCFNFLGHQASIVQSAIEALAAHDIDLGLRHVQPHAYQRSSPQMADVSGLVGRLQGCRIVDLRARRLALALLGGRPTLAGGFARRISGARRACRRRVVSASSPHRTAVAGCAGSLRRTGTGEGDLPMEELAALSPGFGTRAERRLLSLGRRRPRLQHRRNAF